MDDFKVSVESLHTARIREINYEGEETYQERLTLSQRLTELAQRVDFSDFVKDNTDDTGPAAKKPAQKWPWEFTHSKLKQALTEVSVLSDLLQITNNHRQYLVLDPVAAPQPTGVSPVFQYLAKKKALSVAAGILRSGTKTLSKISSKSEREFHKTLLQLRERWKLRRTPTGIVGDLSFCQMEKSMNPWMGIALQFEVHKREGLGIDLGNILSITIPRELRGRSEVVVFISDKPVREVDSLSAIPKPPLLANQQQKTLPLWEEKLVAAQNILFNQELFFQLVRESREQKTCLQLEILTNRVNIPLTTGHWISVLHVRDYGTPSEQPNRSMEGPPPQPNGSAEGLPPVRWELVVALKQLLRASHHHREALNAPQPSIASFNESRELREAGVRALTGAQIKELEYRSNLFARFLQMSKHLCNEQSFKQWLLELKVSCSDPVVMVTWAPDPSLSSTSAFLHLSTPSRESPHTLEVQLSVDTVTIHQINGTAVTVSFDKERIMPLLKHQVVLYQSQLVQRVAGQCKWHVMQSFSHPLPSCALNRAGTAAVHTLASNIVLESDDATKRLDVLLEWGKVSLSLAVFPTSVTTEENITMLKPKVNTFQLGVEHGQHLVERFRNMLTSLG
ncbi:hypothetical protein EMCRGX_G032558 [Ephydatia muelleri]